MQEEILPFITTQEAIHFFEKYSISYSPRINRALFYLEDIYKEETRHSGQLYFNEHILPVTKAVLEMTPSKFHSEELVLSSLLHDTIEDDPNINSITLTTLFGYEVANWVKYLSKSSKSNPFAAIKLLHPIRDYIYHGKLIKAPWQVKMIKACDRYNNMLCSYVLYSQGKKREKGEAFVKEVKANSLEISKQLDDEIGSKTYNQFNTLLIKFENLINATKLKSSTTEGSRS